MLNNIPLLGQPVSVRGILCYAIVQCQCQAKEPLVVPLNGIVTCTPCNTTYHFTFGQSQIQLVVEKVLTPPKPQK